MRKHNQDPKSQGSKKAAQTKTSTPFLRAPVKAIKFDHELLAAPLIKNYQRRLDLIESILKTQAKQDVRLAKGLRQLLSAIQLNAHKKYERGVDEKARNAFNELVQKQFGIMPARAAEYIKVAENKKVITLGLRISASVEMARLSEKALKQFLAAHPKAKLKKLSYREIKSLTRKSNPKKRATKSANKSVKLVYPKTENLSSKGAVYSTAADRKTAATAELKMAFHSFKAANKKGGMDKGSLTLLKEMRAWIEQSLSQVKAKQTVRMNVRKGGAQ